MISQNVYVKFDTFNTRDEVLDFVYDEKELNSNINNWKEDLDKYISYKDKHLKNTVRKPITEIYMLII